MFKPTIFALVVMTSAMPAQAVTAKAKISESSARATALALVKDGTVKSSELEHEHGKLIYSFDIVQPKTPGVEEIQISAITGKLVARHHESPAKEAAEAKAEASEGKKTGHK